MEVTVNHAMFRNAKSDGSRRLTFDIHGLDVALVNAIRRVILSEVPHVAFHPDHLRIHANTGALHNEFMAHRLSMIPLCFDADEVYAMEHDDDGGRYRFVLDARNTGTEDLHVTTKDFVLYARDGTVLDERVRSVLPSDPVTRDHVLVTTLRPHRNDPKQGEHLHVECSPVVGIARDNAAWCPVSMCTFQNKVDPAAAEAGFDAWLQEKGGDLTPAEIKEYRQRFFIMDAKRFFFKDDRGEPTAFVFDIESECGLSPQLLVFRALCILRRKVLALRDNHAVEHEREHGDLQVVKISGEGHTFGNLWQALTYNDFYPRAVDFVGYYVPHPLEDRVVLKYRLREASQGAEEARDFFATTCDMMVERLDAVIDAWLQFSKLPKTLGYVSEYIKKDRRAM